MANRRIKQALVRSGLTRLGALMQDKGVAILMYHSVQDQPERFIHSLGGIIHSTTEFRLQMRLLAREYHPVSLEQVLRFVQGQQDLPRRAVAVTFDDGYADNLEVAAPILAQASVPAAFYVTVQCVDTATPPWPTRVRFAIFTSPRDSWIDEAGISWPLANPASPVSNEPRENAFRQACAETARKSGDAQEDYVHALEAQLQTAALPQGHNLMMSWNQVRRLVSEGHIVGSHTMTHPNMAQIPAQDLSREFTASKRKLEAELSAPVTHFSYPCPALEPHWTPHTMSASRDCGYTTAVTTSHGLARSSDDPLCLRRIRPSKTLEGLRWNLECAFLGRPI